MTLESLDYAFLKWLPVVTEDQKRVQSFYLPLLAGCETVVDVGCGDGNFVELLTEHGFRATGVDMDPQACEAARQRGLNVVQADALAYLSNLPENSVDAFFASHFVEHLHYEQVIALMRAAFRALKPNGRIILTTPDVRGLVSHLEMFYLHFGHVSFYHPRLLSFFLEYTGFVNSTIGENPSPPFPMWGDLRPRVDSRVETHQPPIQTPSISISGSAPNPTTSPETFLASQNVQTSEVPNKTIERRNPHEPIPRVVYQPVLPRSGNPLRQMSWHIKMFLIRMIVQPLLDSIVTDVNRVIGTIEDRQDKIEHAIEARMSHLSELLHRITATETQIEQSRRDIAWLEDQLRQNFDRVAQAFERVDRPFECYVMAHKPSLPPATEGM